MPADPLHDSATVPDPPDIEPGIVHVRPVAGETVADRLTVPVKPLTGETVIIEEPETVAFTLTVVGLAVIVKSVTLNVSQVLLVGLLLASPL